MRVLTAAMGIALLCALAFAVAPVAAQEGPTCQGAPATIVGTGGPIVGTTGPDVIVGTTGADTIYGNGGGDLICGAPDGATSDGGDTHYRGDGSGLFRPFLREPTDLRPPRNTRPP